MIQQLKYVGYHIGLQMHQWLLKLDTPLSVSPYRAHLQWCSGHTLSRFVKRQRIPWLSECQGLVVMGNKGVVGMNVFFHLASMNADCNIRLIPSLPAQFHVAKWSRWWQMRHHNIVRMTRQRENGFRHVLNKKKICCCYRHSGERKWRLSLDSRLII